jgi:hypothetical protein
MDASPSYSYQIKNALPGIYMAYRGCNETDAAQQRCFPLYPSISRK